MSVQRLSLANIVTELKRIAGFPGVASSDTPWNTDEDLYRIVNGYGQRLSIRCAQVMGDMSPTRPVRAMRFDMNRAVVTATQTDGELDLQVTTGSRILIFPADLDEIVSLWDLTYEREVDKIEDIEVWHPEIKKRKPGPPEYYEIRGMIHGTYSKRFAYLYPAPPSTVTPAIQLTYWRLPSIMAGTSSATEYPAADPKYHWLWVYGPALEILRPSHPAYERYAALEKELLIDMAKTANWV